jgi:hypothetical protein
MRGGFGNRYSIILVLIAAIFSIVFSSAWAANVDACVVEMHRQWQSVQNISQGRCTGATLDTWASTMRNQSAGQSSFSFTPCNPRDGETRELSSDSGVCQGVDEDSMSNYFTNIVVLGKSAQDSLGRQVNVAAVAQAGVSTSGTGSVSASASTGGGGSSGNASAQADRDPVDNMLAADGFSKRQDGSYVYADNNGNVQIAPDQDSALSIRNQLHAKEKEAQSNASAQATQPTGQTFCVPAPKGRFWQNTSMMLGSVANAVATIGLGVLAPMYQYKIAKGDQNLAREHLATQERVAAQNAELGWPTYMGQGYGAGSAFGAGGAGLYGMGMGGGNGYGPYGSGSGAGGSGIIGYDANGNPIYGPGGGQGGVTYDANGNPIGGGGAGGAYLNVDPSGLNQAIGGIGAGLGALTQGVSGLMNGGVQVNAGLNNGQGGPGQTYQGQAGISGGGGLGSGRGRAGYDPRGAQGNQYIPGFNANAGLGGGPNRGGPGQGGTGRLAYDANGNPIGGGPGNSFGVQGRVGPGSGNAGQIAYDAYGRPINRGMSGGGPSGIQGNLNYGSGGSGNPLGSGNGYQGQVRLGTGGSGYPTSGNGTMGIDGRMGVPRGSQGGGNAVATDIYGNPIYSTGSGGYPQGSAQATLPQGYVVIGRDPATGRDIVANRSGGGGVSGTGHVYTGGGGGPIYDAGWHGQPGTGATSGGQYVFVPNGAGPNGNIALHTGTGAMAVPSGASGAYNTGGTYFQPGGSSGVNPQGTTAIQGLPPGATINPGSVIMINGTGGGGAQGTGGLTTGVQGQVLVGNEVQRRYQDKISTIQSSILSLQAQLYQYQMAMGGSATAQGAAGAPVVSGTLSGSAGLNISGGSAPSTTLPPAGARRSTVGSAGGASTQQGADDFNPTQ